MLINSNSHTPTLEHMSLVKAGLWQWSRKVTCVGNWRAEQGLWRLIPWVVLAAHDALCCVFFPTAFWYDKKILLCSGPQPIKSDPKVFYDYYYYYSLFWFLYLGKCFMLHLGFVLKQTQRHNVKTQDLVPYEHGNFQVNVLLVENI